MIAGEDKKFVWADAEIAGDTVVVSSKDLPHPSRRALRMGWQLPVGQSVQPGRPARAALPDGPLVELLRHVRAV
jgi:sialate O-acetylesterase